MNSSLRETDETARKLAELLEFSSCCAAPVIQQIVRRGTRDEVKISLRDAQRRLAERVLELAPRNPGGTSDAAPLDPPSPLIWVNAYYAENFEALEGQAVRAEKRPELYYIFNAATLGQYEDLCTAVHARITEEIKKRESPNHLSNLLAKSDAPEETVLYLDLSHHDHPRLAVAESRIFDSSWQPERSEGKDFFDQPAEREAGSRLDCNQWYAPILWAEADGAHPERANWVYVHIGLAQRRVLSVCAAGVYFMMGSVGEWQALRPYLKSAFRNFLLDILLSHTFQRTHDAERAQLGQARAWAHDVKNFTSAIHGSLESAAAAFPEAAEDEDSRALRDATEGVVILNSVAVAIHTALSARSGVALNNDRQLQRLPAAVGCKLVCLAFQYLLRYHRRWYQEYNERFYLISTGPEEGTQDVVQALAAVLSVQESDHYGDETSRTKTVLSDPRVVWAVALLREVVWNINFKYRVGDRPTIHVEYSCEQRGRQVVLTVSQKWLEKTNWLESWGTLGLPEGLKSANDLYGDNGVRLGHIALIRSTAEPLPTSKCYQCNLVLAIHLSAQGA